MMTQSEAVAAAEMFREIGGFSKVEVEQFGGEFAKPTNPWHVNLWSVNARAGNRNLTVISTLPGYVSDAKRLARQALGKATAADKAAFARQAADREMDRE